MKIKNKHRYLQNLYAPALLEQYYVDKAAGKDPVIPQYDGNVKSILRGNMEEVNVNDEHILWGNDISGAWVETVQPMKPGTTSFSFEMKSIFKEPYNYDAYWNTPVCLRGPRYDGSGNDFIAGILPLISISEQGNLRLYVDFYGTGRGIGYWDTGIPLEFHKEYHWKVTMSNMVNQGNDQFVGDVDLILFDENGDELGRQSVVGLTAYYTSSKTYIHCNENQILPGYPYQANTEGAGTSWLKIEINGVTAAEYDFSASGLNIIDKSGNGNHAQLILEGRPNYDSSITVVGDINDLRQNLRPVLPPHQFDSNGLLDGSFGTVDGKLEDAFYLKFSGNSHINLGDSLKCGSRKLDGSLVFFQDENHLASRHDIISTFGAPSNNDGFIVRRVESGAAVNTLGIYVFSGNITCGIATVVFTPDTAGHLVSFGYDIDAETIYIEVDGVRTEADFSESVTSWTSNNICIGSREDELNPIYDGVYDIQLKGDGTDVRIPLDHKLGTIVQEVISNTIHEITDPTGISWEKHSKAFYAEAYGVKSYSFQESFSNINATHATYVWNSANEIEVTLNATTPWPEVSFNWLLGKTGTISIEVIEGTLSSPDFNLYYRSHSTASNEQITDGIIPPEAIFLNIGVNRNLITSPSVTLRCKYKPASWELKYGEPINAYQGHSKLITNPGNVSGIPSFTLTERKDIQDILKMEDDGKNLVVTSIPESKSLRIPLGDTMGVSAIAATDQHFSKFRFIFTAAVAAGPYFVHCGDINQGVCVGHNQVFILAIGSEGGSKHVNISYTFLNGITYDVLLNEFGEVKINDEIIHRLSYDFEGDEVFSHYQGDPSNGVWLNSYLNSQYIGENDFYVHHLEQKFLDGSGYYFPFSEEEGSVVTSAAHGQHQMPLSPNATWETAGYYQGHNYKYGVNTSREGMTTVDVNKKGSILEGEITCLLVPNAVQYLFDFREGSDISEYLYATADNALQFGAHLNNDPSYNVGLYLNEWHTYRFRFDKRQGNYKLYIDGNLVLDYTQNEHRGTFELATVAIGSRYTDTQKVTWNRCWLKLDGEELFNYNLTEVEAGEVVDNSLKEMAELEYSSGKYVDSPAIMPTQVDKFDLTVRCRPHFTGQQYIIGNYGNTEQDGNQGWGLALYEGAIRFRSHYSPNAYTDWVSPYTGYYNNMHTYRVVSELVNGTYKKALYIDGVLQESPNVEVLPDMPPYPNSTPNIRLGSYGQGTLWSGGVDFEHASLKVNSETLFEYNLKEKFTVQTNTPVLDVGTTPAFRTNVNDSWKQFKNTDILFETEDIVEVEYDFYAPAISRVTQSWACISHHLFQIATERDITDGKYALYLGINGTRTYIQFTADNWHHLKVRNAGSNIHITLDNIDYGWFKNQTDHMFPGYGTYVGNRHIGSYPWDGHIKNFSLKRNGVQQYYYPGDVYNSGTTLLDSGKDWNYAFDGESYVDTPVQYFKGNKVKITVDVFIESGELTGEHVIASCRPSAVDKGMVFMVVDGNKLRLYTYGDYGQSRSTLNDTVPLDRWVNIGFEYDPSDTSVKFFIDGTEESSWTYDNGQANSSDSGWIVGKLYRAVAFNYVERMKNMRMEINGEEVLYYPMQDMKGQDTEDHSKIKAISSNRELAGDTSMKLSKSIAHPFSGKVNTIRIEGYIKIHEYLNPYNDFYDSPISYNDDLGFSLRVFPSGIIEAIRYGKTGYLSSDSCAIERDKWYHIILETDSSTYVKMWVNGVLYDYKNLTILIEDAISGASHQWILTASYDDIDSSLGNWYSLRDFKVAINGVEQGHWKMNEGSGTTALDSGKSYFAHLPQKEDQSATVHTESIVPIKEGLPIELEYYIRIYDIVMDDSCSVCEWREGSSAGFGNHIRHISSNDSVYFYFYVYDGVRNPTIYRSFGDFDAFKETWHHVKYVVTDTEVNFYLDGTLQGTVQINTTDIAAWVNPSNSYFRAGDRTEGFDIKNIKFSQCGEVLVDWPLQENAIDYSDTPVFRVMGTSVDSSFETPILPSTKGKPVNFDVSMDMKITEIRQDWNYISLWTDGSDGFYIRRTLTTNGLTQIHLWSYSHFAETGGDSGSMYLTLPQNYENYPWHSLRIVYRYMKEFSVYIDGVQVATYDPASVKPIYEPEDSFYSSHGSGSLDSKYLMKYHSFSRNGVEEVLYTGEYDETDGVIDKGREWFYQGSVDAYVQTELTYQEEEKVVVEADLKLLWVEAGKHQMPITKGDDMYISFYGTDKKLYVKLNNVDGPSNYPVLAPEGWFNFRMEYVHSKKEFKIYFDDALVVTDTHPNGLDITAEKWRFLNWFSTVDYAYKGQMKNVSISYDDDIHLLYPMQDRMGQDSLDQSFMEAYKGKIVEDHSDIVAFSPPARQFNALDHMEIEFDYCMVERGAGSPIPISFLRSTVLGGWFVELTSPAEDLQAFSRANISTWLDGTRYSHNFTIPEYISGWNHYKVIINSEYCELFVNKTSLGRVNLLGGNPFTIEEDNLTTGRINSYGVNQSAKDYIKNVYCSVNGVEWFRYKCNEGTGTVAVDSGLDWYNKIDNATSKITTWLGDLSGVIELELEAKLEYGTGQPNLYQIHGNGFLMYNLYWDGTNIYFAAYKDRDNVFRYAPYDFGGDWGIIKVMYNPHTGDSILTINGVETSDTGGGATEYTFNRALRAGTDGNISYTKNVRLTVDGDDVFFYPMQEQSGQVAEDHSNLAVYEGDGSADTRCFSGVFFDPNAGDSILEVEVDVNFTDATPLQVFAGTRDGVKGILLGFVNTNTFRYYGYTSTGTEVLSIVIPVDLVNGEWHKFRYKVDYDSMEFSVWLDGSFVRSRSITGLPDSTIRELTVLSQPTGGYFLNGKAKNIIAWKDGVEQFRYLCNEGSGTTAIDRSGNGNDGTLSSEDIHSITFKTDALKNNGIITGNVHASEAKASPNDGTLDDASIHALVSKDSTTPVKLNDGVITGSVHANQEKSSPKNGTAASQETIHRVRKSVDTLPVRLDGTTNGIEYREEDKLVPVPSVYTDHPDLHQKISKTGNCVIPDNSGTIVGDAYIHHQEDKASPNDGTQSDDSIYVQAVRSTVNDAVLYNTNLEKVSISQEKESPNNGQLVSGEFRILPGKPDRSFYDMYGGPINSSGEDLNLGAQLLRLEKYSFEQRFDLVTEADEEIIDDAGNNIEAVIKYSKERSTNNK